MKFAMRLFHVARFPPWQDIAKSIFLSQIPDDRHWNISFHGAPEFQEDSLHSRDMNIGWVMHDPGDRDPGLYVCRVYYLSPQKNYRYVIGGQQVHGKRGFNVCTRRSGIELIVFYFLDMTEKSADD